MKRFLVFILFLLLIPTLYAQWDMINSPQLAPDIRKVEYHPNGYIFAITNVGELFRSIDNSNTWTKLTTFTYLASCIKINTEGDIYIGCSGGYFVSSDYGITWLYNQVFLDGNVFDIEFVANRIFLAQFSLGSVPNGIWISSDNGNSWIKSTAGLNGEAIEQITKDSFGCIYAITQWGELFKSTDSGQTWVLKIDIPGSGHAMEIDSNDKIFVGGSGIWKSTDFGNTWFQVNNELTFNIYIDSQNNIYSHNHNDLMLSSNGGSSWTNIPYTGPNIEDVISINDTIFIGTENGLQKSNNFGANWDLCFRYTDKFVKVNDVLFLENKIIATGKEGLYIYQYNGNNWDIILGTNMNLIKKDKEGILYATESLLQGVLYRSTDEGVSWTECLDYVRNFYINDSNYIFATQYSKVLKSTDHGFSWAMIFPGATYISEIYGISQNSSGSVFISTYHRFYVPGYGYVYTTLLLRTDNDGATWSQIRDDRFYNNIYFYGNTMYLTTSNGIFKSTNNGLTITPLNNGLTNLQINKMLITSSGILLCVTGNGIHRSLDNGNNWVRLDHSGLLSSTVNGVYLTEDYILYACTDNGIGIFVGDLPVELTFFTAKISQYKVHLNWQTATELNNQGFEIQRKFENSDWATIGFRAGKGTTTEPTSYFYEDDISEISVTKILYRLKQIDFDGTTSYSDEVEVITQPFDYALLQNYPNPFNPETIIKYEVPQISNVKIEVFDILGRVIKVLVDEQKTAGRYETKFDASSLASGIYYYRIKANEFVQTKKMMLIK